MTELDTFVMDAYRGKVIKAVGAHPVLWDPRHKDYKNKEERKLVWSEIDKLLYPPPAPSINAKTTWDHLSKGFSNALKRREKRAGNGLVSDIEWKFEGDMMFLLPAKKTRLTMGHLLMEDSIVSEVKYDNDSSSFTDHVGSHSRTGSAECDNNSVCFSEEEIDLNNEQETDIEAAGVDEGMTMNSLNSAEIESERKYLLELGQKSKREGTDKSSEGRQPPSTVRHSYLETGCIESVRLGFFRSLMPVVDSLSDEEFLDFQLDVLQNLRKFRKTSLS